MAISSTRFLSWLSIFWLKSPLSLLKKLILSSIDLQVIDIDLSILLIISSKYKFHSTFKHWNTNQEYNYIMYKGIYHHIFVIGNDDKFDLLF